jgi:hypothetical protein
MGPVALHTYAEAYLIAARSLPEPESPFDLVRSYLACHAIELALKAYLSLHGALMLDLSGTEFGHKLDALLEHADRKRLADTAALSRSHRIEILRASVYYEGKVFEYPAVGEALRGYPGKAALPSLLEAAHVLIEALRIPCGNAR